MASFDAKKFVDFVKFFDKTNPKHTAAFEELATKVGVLKVYAQGAGGRRFTRPN